MKPATMRYFDAIHAQLEAIDVWKSEIGDQMAVHITDMMLKIMESTPSPADIKNAEIHLLERADPYFLDGEIQEWIMDSVSSFPRDIAIGDVLPPSDRGWILFERPIMGTAEQDYGFPAGWEALAWSTTHNIYSDMSGEDLPVVALGYYHRTADNHLVLGSNQVWPLREGLREWEDAHPLDMEQRDEGEHRFMMMQHRFVIGLFAFMNQPFSAIQPRHLPRAQRRWLQREIGTEDPQVKVITLRRAQHTNGQSEGGSREWSSRWIVKGHWRSQYYPSKQKNSPLWIMPYMKGPQDKPLKGGNAITLFHVTR